MNFNINTLEESIIINLSCYKQILLNSLVYGIETNYVHGNFYGDKDLFDFSDYPQNSTFFDLVNEKVFDKMKNEVKQKMICEFVGLKSKIYSAVTADNKKNLKSKRRQ